MRILGVDVSHWQTAINWQKFYDGGVRFVTVKCSQGDYLLDEMRDDHLKGAADVGAITGVYPWIDPIISVDGNVNKTLEAIRGLPVSYITPDLEQWWTSWEKWRAWTKNPTCNPIPSTFDKHKLYLHSMQVTLELEKNFSGPIIPYTRTSFIRNYMPEFATFMCLRKMYIAQYPRVFTKGTKITWQEVPNYMPLPNWKPILPNTGTDARMVQWSGDTFIVPGYDRVIDLDYFDGTEEEMKIFLGATTNPPTIEPSLEEKVEILWKEYLNNL